MKNRLISTFAVALAAASLFAAPGKGPVYETVAEGYPAWAGLTDANFIMGRYLCPSDLRQKMTVVVFVDAAKYEEQVKQLSGTYGYNQIPIAFASVAEQAEIKRDTIFLLVLVGKVEDKKAVCKFLTPSSDKELAEFSKISQVFFAYQNVTCSKVDYTDKLPYVCAFGAEPGEPLVSGKMSDEIAKKLPKLRADKKNRPETWKPYFGSIEEPKYQKNFAKIVASGKPLDGLTGACKKGISSKDPEQAKESQILYDALEQTRSEYMYSIQSLARAAPTRALYEATILTKQWPKTKKLMKPQIDRMKNLPDMKVLADMFVKIKTWGSDDFQCKNASEAKKIAAELKKMKAACDGIVQKSSSTIAQRCAAWLANEADTLGPLMESKVQSK